LRNRLLPEHRQGLDLRRVHRDVLEAVEAAFKKMESTRATAGAALARLRKNKCTWAAASDPDDPGWQKLLKDYDNAPRILKQHSDLAKRVTLAVRKCFGGPLEKALRARDNPTDGTFPFLHDVVVVTPGR
jgi:hypothetical protein